MTARKPATRKASGPTLAARVANLEANDAAAVYQRADLARRIAVLESRDRLRDKSHDAPVSNAGEAVGQHFRIVDELPHASWWRRFLNFMGAP